MSKDILFQVQGLIHFILWTFMSENRKVTKKFLYIWNSNLIIQRWPHVIPSIRSCTLYPGLNEAKYCVKLLWNYSFWVNMYNDFIDLHRLYIDCTSTVHQLYTHCTPTVHPLYTDCMPTVHQLYTDCTATVHFIKFQSAVKPTRVNGDYFSYTPSFYIYP